MNKIRLAMNMKSYGGKHYGAGKFCDLLKEYLINTGEYEIVDDYESYEYDIALPFQFFNFEPTTNMGFIEQLINRGIPFIQRIDGPGPRNSPQRQSSIETFTSCDCVIFQSEFIKRFWKKEFDLDKPINAVIHNGRKDNFHKSEYYKTTAYARNMYSSFSSLLNYAGDRKSTPLAVIKAIPDIVKKWPGFTYDIYGSLKEFELELDDIFFEQPTLRSYVSVGGFHLNKSLESVRMFKGVCWHLREDDPCPNNVVECMSMGIPVIGVKECGTGELVSDAGVCISKGHLDPDLLTLAYTNIMNYHEEYVKMTQKRFMENFHINIIGKKYKDVIERVLNGK